MAALECAMLHDDISITPLWTLLMSIWISQRLQSMGPTCQLGLKEAAHGQVDGGWVRCASPQEGGPWSSWVRWVGPQKDGPWSRRWWMVKQIHLHDFHLLINIFIKSPNACTTFFITFYLVSATFMITCLLQVNCMAQPRCDIVARPY